MTWYVVYRGRKPGVYQNWVACHQQVTTFHNCCYKSFNCKEVAIASYLEFTGEPVVSIEGDVPKIGAHLPSSGKLCVLFIAIIKFIIILGLLMFIYVSSP
jgi:hypothetical protein